MNQIRSINRYQAIAAFVLGFIAFIGQAKAASFDCAKAHTKIEHQICANPELSKLDEELAKDYDAATKHASKGRRFLIRWQERRWLSDRDKCSNNACLIEKYKQRIAILNAHPAYALVMSKSEKLCNNLLNIFNSDMNHYGKIKFSKHDIFSHIDWKPAPSVGAFKAYFDLINDGKIQLVFLKPWSMFGSTQDAVYAYDDRAIINDPRELKNAPIKLDIMKYDLNDVPPAVENNYAQLIRSKLSPSLRAAVINVELGPYFVFHPFIHDRHTYIYMADNLYTWIVIATLIKTNKVSDVCYYYDPDLID